MTLEFKSEGKLTYRALIKAWKKDMTYSVELVTPTHILRSLWGRLLGGFKSRV